MANLKAIDISKHQATFDAAKAKAAGVELVVCRAAYSTGKDIRWDAFTAAARGAGLPLAAYGFLTAHYKTKCEGSLAAARNHMRAQVGAWLDIIKGTEVQWLAVDQELEQGYSMGLSVSDNTALLHEACELIRAAGVQPVVYCSVSWGMTRLDARSVGAPMWLAYYYKDPSDPDFGTGTLPGGTYGEFMQGLASEGMLLGWQFGRIGYGVRYGVGSANVDRNYFYQMGDKPMEFVKIAGKQLVVTSTKPACEVFSAPDTAAVLGKLAEGTVHAIKAVGDTVELAGMTGTWYCIEHGGIDAYVLALPDRCAVGDVVIAPEAGAEPEPSVSGVQVIGEGKLADLLRALAAYLEG